MHTNTHTPRNMLLQSRISLRFLVQPKSPSDGHPRIRSVKLEAQSNVSSGQALIVTRIKEGFRNVKLSSNDTAWVAMEASRQTKSSEYMYEILSMVDHLARMGIDRYFRVEIDDCLNEAYRCWIQKSDEIFLDEVACIALAFRLLRVNGYDVSSDELEKFTTEESYLDSIKGLAKDTRTILELFRTSEIPIFQNETVLEKIQAWTSSYLKGELLNGTIQEKTLQDEVDYALKYTQASHERIDSRRNIECPGFHYVHLLKTSYRYFNIDIQELSTFAAQDFNLCQALHRKELDHLEGWVRDYRLDSLKYLRLKTVPCLYMVASELFEPDFSNARMAWAKVIFLGTIADDLFDDFGTMEELLNLVELVGRWDEHSAVGYCSEQVKTLFSAIYETVNDLASMASIKQGRNVRNHFIQIWVRYLKSYLREAEWTREKMVPMFDEYLSNGMVSCGVELVAVITLYFLGSDLSEEVIESFEFKSLLNHTAKAVRFLNDMQTTEREMAQGKLNSVALRVIESNGAYTMEEIKGKMQKQIEMERIELLRLVLQKQGSVVPEVCKQMFWKTSKICHNLYLEDDGYTNCEETLLNDINAVLCDPIVLPIT